MRLTGTAGQSEDYKALESSSCARASIVRVRALLRASSRSACELSCVRALVRVRSPDACDLLVREVVWCVWSFGVCALLRTSSCVRAPVCVPS